MIGKSIIRFGERRVLSLEYFSLVFIFMAYATTDFKWMVAVLYILDHIFFNFSIAIRTYFQKVGDPRGIAPSMAVGFTINHIAAVFLPAIGGFLWVVDYRIPFSGIQTFFSTTVHSLMPQFCILEHYYEKRYILPELLDSLNDHRHQRIILDSSIAMPYGEPWTQ